MHSTRSSKSLILAVLLTLGATILPAQVPAITRVLYTPGTFALTTTPEITLSGQTLHELTVIYRPGGTPGGIDVWLEGSYDGVSWFQISDEITSLVAAPKAGTYSYAKVIAYSLAPRVRGRRIFTDTVAYYAYLTSASGPGLSNVYENGRYNTKPISTGGGGTAGLSDPGADCLIQRQGANSTVCATANSLGSGTPDNTTVLYGDRVWRPAPTGGSSNPFALFNVLDTSATTNYHDSAPTIHNVFSSGGLETPGYTNSSAFSRNYTTFNGGSYQDFLSGKRTYYADDIHFTALAAGQRIGKRISMNCQGDGDCIAQEYALVCNGGASQPGDEQCMGMRMELFGPQQTNNTSTIATSRLGNCLASTMAGGVSRVSTSGTTVTLISGNIFQQHSPGDPLTINGTPYTIASIGGAGVMTVSPSVGTLANAELLMSIIPQDDPAGGSLQQLVKVNTTSGCLNEPVVFSQPANLSHANVFGNGPSSDSKGYVEAAFVVAVDSGNNYLTARFRSVHGVGDALGRPRILTFNQGVAAGQKALVCDQTAAITATDTATIASQTTATTSGTGISGGGFTNSIVGGNAGFPGSISLGIWNQNGARTWVPMVSVLSPTAAVMDIATNFKVSTPTDYKIAPCSYNLLTTQRGTGKDVIVDQVIMIATPFTFAAGHEAGFPSRTQVGVSVSNILVHADSPLADYHGLNIRNLGAYTIEAGFSLDGNYGPTADASFRNGINLTSNMTGTGINMTGKMRFRADQDFLGYPGGAMLLSTFPKLSDDPWEDRKDVIWANTSGGAVSVLGQNTVTSELLLTNSHDPRDGRTYLRQISRAPLFSAPAEIGMAVTNLLQVEADTTSRRVIGSAPATAFSIRAGSIADGVALGNGNVDASVPASFITLAAFGSAANMGIQVSTQGLGSMRIPRLVTGTAGTARWEYFNKGTCPTDTTFTDDTGTTTFDGALCLDSDNAMKVRNLDGTLTSLGGSGGSGDAISVAGIAVSDNASQLQMLDRGWSSVSSTNATSGANSNSPLNRLAASYWNGTASATDAWTSQIVLGAGTNPSSTLTFTHSSGSSGQAGVSVPVLFAGSLVSASYTSLSGYFAVSGGTAADWYTDTFRLYHGNFTGATAQFLCIGTDSKVYGSATACH